MNGMERAADADADAEADDGLLIVKAVRGNEGLVIGIRLYT
jgi:hypothetical protein